MGKIVLPRKFVSKYPHKFTAGKKRFLCGQRILPKPITGKEKLPDLMDRVFLAFDYRIALTSLVIGYTIGYAVGTLAPTPGGLGAIEALLITTFVGFGVPPAEAVASVLVYRFINFWMPIPPGLISYVAIR